MSFLVEIVCSIEKFLQSSLIGRRDCRLQRVGHASSTYGILYFFHSSSFVETYGSQDETDKLTKGNGNKLFQPCLRSKATQEQAEDYFAFLFPWSIISTSCCCLFLSLRFHLFFFFFFFFSCVQLEILQIPSEHRDLGMNRDTCTSQNL